MSIAITALSRQARKLTELPRNHSWIYGVGSREEERGQEKRGRGDTRSRKRWDVAEWQRIENTKQRRDKREQNGWNGQGSSLYRKDDRVACPTVSSSTFIAV